MKIPTDFKHTYLERFAIWLLGNTLLIRYKKHLKMKIRRLIWKNYYKFGYTNTGFFIQESIKNEI